MKYLCDLGPRLSPPGGAYQSLVFTCPRCGAHEIEVNIWNGPHGDHIVPVVGLKNTKAVRRLWHAEQGPYNDWDSLTITPSIDRTGVDKCGGWHGVITNGEATP